MLAHTDKYFSWEKTVFLVPCLGSCTPGRGVRDLFVTLLPASCGGWSNSVPAFRTVASNVRSTDDAAEIDMTKLPADAKVYKDRSFQKIGAYRLPPPAHYLR
jgi:hypothetical protein